MTYVLVFMIGFVVGLFVMTKLFANMLIDSDIINGKVIKRKINGE